MGPTAFAALMGDGSADPALDEAAIAVAAALQPGLDPIEWLAALDALAGSCPTPTPEGVARHLCDQLGFVGDTGDYGSWRNSCLDQVIVRRRGIPITLAVVMIEVARRVGVELHGIGMPAHFLVGTADGQRFFDPFKGSATIERAAVPELFARVTGGRASWSETFLAPTPPRHIVIRILNNLRTGLIARDDAVRLGIVMQLRAVMPELASDEADEIRAATALFN
ncbi:MAG: transglutaminase-like domain-containing protein [Actinomycetota bacterium]